MWRLALVLAFVAAADGDGQGIARVELRRLDGRSRVVTADDLARLPRREVAASAHHVNGRYAGVALGMFSVSSAALRATVCEAPISPITCSSKPADGYRAVFAVAELDTSFTDRSVLLADGKDGAPLAMNEGPFRVVVPGERRPARWVRGVTRISIVAAPATTPLTTTQPR
jgi:hypothetical protein